MEVRVEIFEGEILAIYTQFAEGKSAKTVEVCPEECLIDLDENGNILGIEFLAPGELRLQVYAQLAREKCPFPDLEEFFQQLNASFITMGASFTPVTEKLLPH
jgi:uncharacterized protein YuzE